MKEGIFVSWSGPESRQIASVICTFGNALGISTQTSDRDLQPGGRWENAIRGLIQNSACCIACITPENVAGNSAWMAHESGIADRWIPLLVKVRPDELPDPSDSRQSVSFYAKEEMRSMFRELFKGTEFDRRFDEEWPIVEEHGKDLAGELLSVPQASKAPFLLARAADIWCNKDFGEGEKKGAMRELINALDTPLTEHDYLAKANRMIQNSSVWAVCGRKSPNTWKKFVDSNQISHEAGRHIERIFYPPDAQNKGQVHWAIGEHLQKAMTVRAFSDPFTAQEFYCRWSLPG